MKRIWLPLKLKKENLNEKYDDIMSQLKSYDTSLYNKKDLNLAFSYSLKRIANNQASSKIFILEAEELNRNTGFRSKKMV